MLARVCPGAGLAGAGIRIDRRSSSLGFVPRRWKVSAAADKTGDLADRNINQRVSFSICHNVQDGETLTSIARHYNSSVQTIALANKIDDIDLLQTGRILLVPVHPGVFQKVAALVIEESPATSQKIASTVVQPHASAARVVSELPSFVKSTASLLLLVPVVVLCFRALFKEAERRIQIEVSRAQAEKELRDVQHRPRLQRWQKVLDADRESDEAVLTDGQEAAEVETEEQKIAREEEELRKSYVELEATYIQFLQDSGLSRSGYWRGGIPSSSHHEGQV